MPPQIRSAIERLSADDWRQRDQAQRDLVELGSAAAPWLEALARSSQDFETITRAEAALREIHLRAADSPTLVSLRLRDAHPRQVIEELCRQGKLELAGDVDAFWGRHRWPRIDFEAEREPFWMAMLRACREASLEPGYSRRNRALTLGREEDPDHWHTHQFVAAGPFAVFGGEVRLRKPDEPVGESHSGIELTVFADPRFKVVYRHAVEVREAVDEHGQSLLFPYRPATPERADGDAWMWEAYVPLEPPDGPRRPERVARLRGEVHVAVQTQSETLTIPNILAAGGQRHHLGKARVFVEDAQRRTDGMNIRFILHWAGQDPMNWALQRAVMMTEHFRLVDAAGQDWACNDLDSDLSPDRIVVRLQFDASGRRGQQQPKEPFDLVMELPTHTRPLIAPFELRDLPVRQ